MAGFERPDVAERLAWLSGDAPGFRRWWEYWLRSSALLLPHCTGSIWVHGETPLQFDAARRVIDEATADRPHTRLVLTSRKPATVEYLRAAFPDDQTCPAPLNWPWCAARFFACFRPRVLLLLEEGRSLGRSVFERARRDGLAVAALNVASAGAVSELWRSAGVLCAAEESVAAELQARGIGGERIAVTGPLDLDPGRPALSFAPETLRAALRVSAHTAVLLAMGVPDEEEEAVLEGFARLREALPDSRLVLEPRRRVRAQALLRAIAGRGWNPWHRSSPLPANGARQWDVLVECVPGEIASFLPAASAAYIGGGPAGHAAGGELAAALAAGCPAASGPPADLGDKLIELTRGRGRKPPPLSSDATRRTLEVLRPLLPPDPLLPRVCQAWRVPTLRDRAGRSRLWKWVASVFMGRRIDDWDALRERLGAPRAVLCLGNGPSAADARLPRLPYDCLLRVNWRWQSDGAFNRPRVVFVGDPRTIQRVSGCIFGIWNIDLEYGMLLRRLATRGPGRIEYFTMERISPLVRDHAWPARPSNGALMVAAGAALRPERLIVAGIDLFQHPEGRYPGDLRSRNAYSHVHSRHTDLGIMRLALCGYHGELTILSDILRRALREEAAASGF